MILCGIDPGLSGALAFLETTKPPRPVLTAIVPMPTTWEKGERKVGRRRLYDWVGVQAALREFHPDAAIVEAQWPRPHEGVVSAFRAGTGFGGIMACLACLGIPTTFVNPAEWKNALGLTKTDKKASQARASQLLPEGRALWARHKDHGLAEAALIALWKVAYEHQPLTRSIRPGRKPAI